LILINGITFIVSGVEYHSWDDFHLIRTEKSIGKAKVKKYEVDIEGADGVLDFTEYFGEPKYENRPLSFSFECIEKQDTFDDLYSDIQNALHGQKGKIILDDDADFYYVGRIDVNDWKSDKSIGKIVIDVDAEPYKYNIDETVVENTVTGTQTLTYSNLRKAVVPTIKTTGSVQIVFGDTSWNIDAGTYKMPELQFVKGDNVLTVTGNATITVTYQEGGL